MAFFDATLAALAAGQHVAVAMLVEFDFLEGMFRVWDGAGSITVGANTYLGAGEWGSISEIEFGENDAADKITFLLSGVDPDVIVAAQDSESVRGRDVFIYGQFLDTTTLAPYDARWPIRQLIMDTLAFSARGPSQRSIMLSCETIWTNRNHAAYAFYSDKNQQERFPGDRGLEFLPTLKNKITKWPVFPGSG